jgi:uncharacterized ferritin-like protein (DUF455 family)
LEVRAFAERVLLSPALEEKLRPVEEPVSDSVPGPSVRHMRPARSANLQFGARRTAPALARGKALRDPLKRGVAHHILANHELQALEVMAWTLCVFPSAPAEFRRGMVDVMADEQRHTRMHVERARSLGVEFGQYPVNSYIWDKAMSFQNELDYLAGLPLVFEGRNLDHTLELAAEFAAVGDERSAALMRIIHRDEIRHVRFGVEWLNRLKLPEWSDWEAFVAHLHWPIRPSKARGTVFQRTAREQAGLSTDFIDRLAAADDDVTGLQGGAA